MKVRHLYVHVPFCKKKCYYCDFYSKTELSLMGSYLRALSREAAAVSNQCSLLRSIYIGGGTPSVLGPARMKKLLEILGKNFKNARGCETTAEINPESADGETLKILKSHGVNRISIGFQFLNNRLLEKAGRIHDAKTAVAAFRRARKAGFENINVDIMYGFPSQTLRELRYTISKIPALKPEHISAYLYTPPDRSRQRWPAGTVREDEASAMYRIVCSALQKHGYRHYEISNFAKPGRESVHNLACWRQQNYMGLGPGAVSTVDCLRTQNPELPSYLRRQKGNKEILSPDVKRFEKKFLSARTLDGIPYRKKHAPLVKKGYLKKKNGRSVFTEKGWLFYGSILNEL